MLKAGAAFSSFSVNDIATAKPFYTAKLGLELIDESMGLNLKLPDGGRVFIYQKDDHQPASFTVLNLIVDDIDEAVQELEDLNIPMERYNDLPATQDAKGVLRGLKAGQGPDIAWFKDPADNILSVLQAV